MATKANPTPGAKGAKPKKKKSKGHPVRKTLRGIFTAVLAMVLVAVLTIMVVGSYFFVNASAVINDKVNGINLEAEKANQSQTTIIYAIDKKTEKWKEYKRLHGEENRVWVDLSSMGDINTRNPESQQVPYLADAYIALEDKRFWDHNGVDWIRFIGIMTKFGFSQGASTLTQQLIKNLTNQRDVTTIRKYREILSALNLEKNYTKPAILEAYLNTLYLGHGCYGVRTGAEVYFGKDVKDLNIAECAVLAVITKAPYYYDPLINPEHNRERQLVCLQAMYDQGKITKTQYDEAVAYPLVFTNSPGYKPSKAEEKPKPETEEFNNYYVDFIIDTVIRDLMKQKELSMEQATEMVYSGGLKIQAAVDTEIQEIVENVYRNRITFSSFKATADHPAPQSSMTIMDYEGRVVAIVGGAGEKTENRSLNRAADSHRQPGSTIKPLATYAPALEQKMITWSTLTLDKAFAYKGMMWPINFDKTYGSGNKLSTQYAIKQSLNTVPARIINELLTVDASYNYLAENFGFQKLDSVNDRVLPAMAVGGMTYGFNTLEEASAFACFGNLGTYYAPFCYYLVTDSSGNEIILDRDRTNKRAMSEATADVMCKMLQTVDTSNYVNNGNNKYLKKFQVMAKTGTTSNNYDRWLTAGTPYYIASVWFGYDVNRNLGEITNPSGRIWTEVFNQIHKNLDPSKKFPESKDAVQKSYCRRTGLIASSNCPETASGWYQKDNIPKTCTSCGAPTIQLPQLPGVSTPNSTGGTGTLGDIAQGIIDALGGGR
ncbi:MAG: transglycosylase domain-containing protein [Oscillospiraceae bacterium]|jgi:penicillin-binding protein 1A|nr:transglycosylase domain-containing protein [Oscillospiraceae bacterium]